MRAMAAAAMAAMMLGGATGASAAQRLVDRVAAVVNDEMIPLSEVHERAAPDLQRLEAEGQASAQRRQSALKRALDELIAERLLAAEQSVHGIEVSDQEVELAVDDVRRQNGMDLQTFERALASQGQSLEAYRAKIRKDLAAMKLLGLKVRSKIKVSDEDVRAEYGRRAKMEEAEVEVHARHIVVQVPRGASAEVEAEARKRAEALAQRARAGEEFTALAREHSDSPSKADGGDLGFFKRGEMVGAIERIAFQLKVGEVSDPVRTDFGWHVVQVVERRAGKAEAYEKVREELRERLVREQMQRQTDQYVADLRKQATVDVKIPELK